MADASAPGCPCLHLDLTTPRQHLVRCRLNVRPRGERLNFRLPAWTPGSYMIRDYVRQLEGLEAHQGGRPLELQGSAVEGWSLQPEPNEPVEIRYRILATELSVRTSHLSTDHGFLALAGVALQLEAERWSPHRLLLTLPEGWQAFVPLPGDPVTGWCAASYDELVDTPVEAGPHPQHRFEVAGVPHRWVSWGGDLPRSDPHWLQDVEAVCLACCRLMGEPAPCAPRYLFILHLTQHGYGGLEHDQSTVLQYGRAALGRPEGRRRLLQLVAHEYLHQWNVRRLRPAELTPIDYDRPMVVPSLWFAEGITSYYDQLLPRAAGRMTEEELLEDLGADLSRYRLTPGRRIQSLRQSSQEAWVKLYRQDAHSADSQISYYLKGAVLALLLDLHLRRRGSALAAVLRDLWRSHGRWGRGYGEDDLVVAFGRHSGDLSTLLPLWLRSTDDLPIDDYLTDVGLRLVPESSRMRSMGWQLESAVGRGLRLKRVRRDGPAEQGGLQVGDELIALDSQRLRSPDDLDPLLRLADSSSPQASPRHEVLFCRDGRVRSSSVTSAPPGIERWRLEIDPEAPAAAAERRQSWSGAVP